VIDIAGKPAVFVRGEGGEFELHEVVLGGSGPGVVEILSRPAGGRARGDARRLDPQERAAQGHLRRGPRALAMNLLSAIVAWSLRNRALVLVATLLFIVVGVRSALSAPDRRRARRHQRPGPDHHRRPGAVARGGRAVHQRSRSSGRCPACRRMEQVRSVSKYGLSVVTVVFHDGTDIYFARQLINERMREATEAVPAAYGTPEMGPISTGLGEIFSSRCAATRTR
jgi:hypothetical protein